MNLKKKLILSLYQQHKAKQAKQHRLSYIFWQCTSQCNLNCIHCGSDCVKDPTVPDMPKQDFLKILADIRPYVNVHETMIFITGGEPLLRGDLEECGQAIYEMGYPWGFVTNGMGLDEARLQSLLDAGLHSVRISLDSPREEPHEWFRGKQGSWLHAINAISRVASTPGLEYEVVTCVHKKNIEDLPRLRDLLISIDVTHWRLFTISPKGDAKDNPVLNLSPEEFVQMMDFICNTRKQERMNVSYCCEGYLSDYEMEVRNTPFFCHAGIHIASVVVNGDITACPSLKGRYIQGNIYRDDFWTVWNTRFQIMRNRSWTKKGKCATCKSYKYCQGNSLHLRDEKTGELLYCHLEMMGKETQPEPKQKDLLAAALRFLT